MTILEEIYCDAVCAIAAAGAETERTICANELRSIRNRLAPMISEASRAEAHQKAKTITHT